MNFNKYIFLSIILTASHNVLGMFGMGEQLFQNTSSSRQSPPKNYTPENRPRRSSTYSLKKVDPITNFNKNPLNGSDSPYPERRSGLLGFENDLFKK